MSKRTLLAGAGLTLLALGWGLRAQDSKRDSQITAPLDSTVRLLPVQTLSVETQSAYEVEDRFLGEVESRRYSQLGFELAGTLVSVSCDEGDVVERGQLLAELDTARLEATRSQQEALLKEAEATLTLAETTYKRVSKLTATGAVSSQDLDEATQRRDSAKASIARINAALQSIDVDLAKSRLLAPYAGRIAARHVDEGAIVGAGQVALDVVESGSLEARISVTVSLSESVRPGDDVALRRVDTGETVAASVRQVSPQQDRRTRTVDVLLTISEPGQLLPGDLVEWPMAISVNAEGAWLPRAALTSSTRGLWAVYIAVPLQESAQHQLERREVEVIHLEGDRAYVRGALREGQRIVSTGLQRLVPGQHVTVSGE